MTEKTPSWLERIQRNSWEPEILISGLTITFIFLINDSIYNFFGSITQNLGVASIALAAHAIFIIAINIIKVTLIFHLLLRGLWVSLVGISYVYPNGVINKNLSKNVRHIEFEKPINLVLRIEKICSQVFSYIFIFIFLLLQTVILYTPIVIVESLLLDNSDTYLYGYIALLFATSIYIAISKKSRLKIWLSRNINNTVLNIISSNTRKKNIIIILLFLIIISVPLSFAQIKDFNFRNSSTNIQKDTTSIYLSEEHYFSKRNNERRVQKACIDEFKITDKKLDLFISKYKDDNRTIRKIKEDSTFSDSIFPLKSLETLLVDLIQISIDDVSMDSLIWYHTELNHLNQKGYQYSIPINHLSNGLHKIQINKIVWNEKNIKNVKGWDIIYFEKTD